MAMDLQRLMSLLRQCMQRYDMVSAGDKSRSDCPEARIA